MNIAVRAKACDSLVTNQTNLINIGLKYEAAQDSVMRIRSRQIVILEGDAKNWEDRYNNQVAMTKIQKKKKRKWVGISLGLVALVIYTNLP